MLKEELMMASEKCGLTDTQMRSGLHVQWSSLQSGYAGALP